MDNKTVLIISEHPADLQELSAALARAEPQRFVPVPVDTRDQPVEALMDPGNDAVILVYSRETDYLLRLAQKKKLSIPIIAMIDEESGSLLNKLYAAGVTDYILRDHIVEDRLFQKLEGKPEFKPLSQDSQVPKADARPGLSPPQDAASRLEQVAPDIPAPADSQARPEPAPARRKNSLKPASKAAPLALAVSGALAAPWKVTIVATLAGLILLSGNLLSQRLASESRLARLEASNDLLVRQLLQLHSDFTQRALTPANPAVVYTAPVPVVSAQPPPAPPAPVGTAPPTAPPTAPTPLASAAPEHLETDSAAPITPITEPGKESWFINLGTFSSGGAARRFANSLGPSSHRREIHRVVMDGRSLYRVRVVDLPSVEAAEALALDYQVTLGGGRPWVGHY